MQELWVDRKQITGFIGSIFIIFGTFLPIYTLNLHFLDQVPVSLIDLPLIGRPLAIILIAMGILSIVALSFEEYTPLYLSGLVSLLIVLGTLILVESGLVIVSGNFPVVSAIVNNLFDYDFGWVVLLAGSAFLLVTPELQDG